MGMRPTGLESGNAATHNGDLQTDTLVFQELDMSENDHIAFSRIYGMSPLEALEYTGMFTASQLPMFLAVCPLSYVHLVKHSTKCQSLF